MPYTRSGAASMSARGSARSAKPGKNPAKKPSSRKGRKGAGAATPDGKASAPVAPTSTAAPPPAISVGALTVQGIAAMITGPVTLQVVAVRRFRRDPTLDSALGDDGVVPAGTAAATVRGNAYDLVLSDGGTQRKCLLAPTLNALIERGELLERSVVSVGKARVRYDETDQNNPGICLLTALEVVTRDVTAVLRRGPNVPAFEDDHDTRAAFVPSLGVRTVYMHPTRDDDIAHGDPGWATELEQADSDDMDALLETWDQLLDPGDIDDELDSPLQYLARVGPMHKTFTPKNQPTLLLMVTDKGHLHTYDSEKQPVPFKPSLRLTDGTVEVAMTMWGAAARRYYYSIEVGEMVLVHGYQSKTIKPQYMPGPTSLWENCRIELSIDTKNPPAVIKAVTPGLLADTLDHPADGDDGRISAATVIGRLVERRGYLPKFTLRSKLDTLPDTTLINYCGMITRLGRENRVRDSRGQFWSYRWIALRDPSSPRSVTMKLFSTSNSTEFDGLLVGMALTCSNLTVQSRIREWWTGVRHIFVQSTRMSAYEGWFPETTSDPATRPYAGSPTVAKLCDWVMGADAAALAKAGFMAGAEGWLPQGLTKPVGIAAANAAPLPTMATVCRDAGAMQLFEARTVSVLATVTAIGFCDQSASTTQLLEPTDDSSIDPAAAAPVTVSRSRKSRKTNKGKASSAPDATPDPPDATPAVLQVGQAVAVGPQPAGQMTQQIQPVASASGIQPAEAGAAAAAVVAGSVFRSVASAVFPVDPRGGEVTDKRLWTVTLLGLNQEAGLVAMVPAGFTAATGMDVATPTPPAEVWQSLGRVLPPDWFPAELGALPTAAALRGCAGLLAGKRVIADLELYRPDSAGVEITVRMLRLP